jgi:hypothetical protein
MSGSTRAASKRSDAIVKYRTPVPIPACC